MHSELHSFLFSSMWPGNECQCSILKKLAWGALSEDSQVCPLQVFSATVTHGKGAAENIQTMAVAGLTVALLTIICVCWDKSDLCSLTLHLLSRSICFAGNLLHWLETEMGVRATTVQSFSSIHSSHCYSVHYCYIFKRQIYLNLCSNDPGGEIHQPSMWFLMYLVHPIKSLKLLSQMHCYP